MNRKQDNSNIQPLQIRCQVKSTSLAKSGRLLVLDRGHLNLFGFSVSITKTLWSGLMFSTIIHKPPHLSDWHSNSGYANIWISQNRLYIGPMKNLIIHPADRSTEFLTPIYTLLKDKTVVTDGITKSELKVLIEIHDRIIMLGHGFQYGLINSGQFPRAGLFIIDDFIAPVLRKKSSGIFIWCHADHFVRTHGLSGICSGMFISEPGEAHLYGYENIDTGLIDQSNERFAAIMSKYIEEPVDLLFNGLIFEYGKLSKTNPIARFNLERLCLCGSGVLYRANKED